MQKINWRLRLQNKNFVLGMIPIVLALIVAVLSLFNIEADLSAIGSKLIDIVVLIFAIYEGVIDPTTLGTSDSVRALNREVLGDD